jgi:hypothetical protein
MDLWKLFKPAACVDLWKLFKPAACMDLWKLFEPAACVNIRKLFEPAVRGSPGPAAPGVNGSDREKKGRDR